MKRLAFFTTMALAVVGAIAVFWAGQTVTASHIQGLVGHWRFDEGSGTIASDSSGHLNDGVINGATFTTMDLAPAPGNVSGLSFDGDDEVVIPDAASLNFGPTDPMTISLWFKLTAPHGVYHILGKRLGCGPMNYQLARDGGLYHFNSSNGRVNAGVDITLGKLTHTAVTYDGNNTIRVYLDGTEVANNPSYPLPTGATGNLEIGSSGGCPESQNFPGVIDDVRIYNRALTAAEIATLASGVLEVAIDIKPGSDPNSINLSSAGVIPVAILSSATFAATTVDPDTVSLAGAKVKMVGKSNRFLCHAEDVNGDGLPDLVCQVETAQFMIEEGASVAVLEAETFDGQAIRGQDDVRIVPQ